MPMFILARMGVWERVGNAERKAMLRLAIDKVIVDQRRFKGMIWARILWQTGAATEFCITRNTRSYAEAAHAEQLEMRIRELNAAERMDAQIADELNAEGLLNSRGGSFDHGTIHLLRKRWGIPTVKINGVTDNPLRWPDGSYSVRGVAKTLEMTEQTVFKWLKKGLLQGRQLTKGQPWQIDLTDEQISLLRERVRRTRPSRRQVS